MASANSLLSEEHFLCSLCMDVFTDPVFTPCGHNYCKACITLYWDLNDVCQCPLCAKIFQNRPEVSVNSFVSEMVHQFRNHKWKEEYDAKTEAEVQQMIQERQVKIQEFKRSVELSRKDADTVIAGSVQVFIAMISCIERSQAELIDVIEEKQTTTEKRAEGFIEYLHKEITRLERRCSVLKQLSHTEDRLHLLHSLTSIDTSPPTKDWTKVNVHQSSYYVETVRTAVAQLEKTLSQEMEKKMFDVELRRIRQYAVDVTLDPDTAQCELILSEDGKQVSHGNIRKNLLNNKERFSAWPCVLGKQSFSSGRFYYEVQVEGADWDLGVVRESIYKAYITWNPSHGSWTIGLRYRDAYWAAADPAVRLPVREEVQKVGVFVDYEEGLVSFYDVEARVHLYSFTGCTFTEKLYPFFNTYSLNNGGTNSAPLTISPVNMDAHLSRDLQGPLKKGT